MKFLIFAASHRKESYNRRLAKLAAAHMKSQGARVDFAEYAEFDLPVYNDEIAVSGGVPEAALCFAERAAKCDGIILASPEYNWSYPGSLKNIIDWTSRVKPNRLAGKTALLMSATTGGRGGITGLAHLKTPLEAISFFVFPRVFPLPHADTAFDGKGALADAQKQQLFTGLLNGYTDFTRKLV
ncbi:MAG: NAD(P)H-dependent oxidoreductase [Pseudomonadota bacterium]|nr:NAD(P)H-dependent oxidoreductase [Pseudomonadota bacterium]MDE3038558.1 NAD(P)H-dependent oxidoreductase [Pseudomonadota bacterium]